MPHIEEWKVAREVIAQLDERIHDLRKYGFTFISGLVTADALLFSKEHIHPWTAFGGCLVTFALLIAMRTIERQYQLLQQAASSRAVVLERFLNVELTEVIADRYHGERWSVADSFVYGMFTAAILLVAAFTCTDAVLIVIASVVAVGVYWLLWRSRLRYPRGQFDWSFDRLECAVGEDILVCVSNLDSSKALVFESGAAIWKVIDVEGKAVYLENAKAQIVVPARSAYYWLWRTAAYAPGLYSFALATGSPLRRRIRITDRKTSPAGENSAAETHR